MNTIYFTLAERMESIRRHSPFTTNFLKIFACISMFVDHAGATVVSHIRYASWLARYPFLAAHISDIYRYMRRFGRLAFPIYCFFIVQGYFRTRDVKKYVQRLLLLALISEYPFDFALHHGQHFMEKQNVYWTLLIGLLVIWAVNDIFRGMTAVQLIIMINGLLLAKVMRTDYQYHGVFLIEMLYITRFSPLIQSLCGGAYLDWYEGFPTPLSMLMTFFYNDKKGRPMKKLFYLFYPAHLLLLGVITWVILK